MLDFELLLVQVQVQVQVGAGTRLSPLRNHISECLLLMLMGNGLINNIWRRMLRAFFMLHNHIPC